MTTKEMWNAVMQNDKQYDGIFYYAVKSTRIFCRPSCKSKAPLEENVLYFDCADAAIKAGYRPCKRCRPDLLEYQPALELAHSTKTTIDRLFQDKAALMNALSELGVSRRGMTEIFVNQYGQTPGEYTNSRRIEAAKLQLASQDHSILDIAYSLGFESLSSFYSFFKKHTKMSPGDYRQQHKEGQQAPQEAYDFTYDLALGKISIASDGSGITAVRFANEPGQQRLQKRDGLTDLTARQLEEYFCGKRKHFELPLHPKGSPFQQSVWAALKDIPYGSTKSYKQVAELIGNPNACRAVGMANNKNPLLILIPCHRVVGADGSLVGYAASLNIKKRLLDLEQSNTKEL